MVRYQTDNVVRISAPISAAPSSENFTLVNEGASHKSPTMGQPRTVNLLEDEPAAPRGMPSSISL
jgi:hypothetical protein